MDSGVSDADASIVVNTGKMKVDDANLAPYTETLASPAKQARRQKANPIVVDSGSDDSSSELSSVPPSSQPAFFLDAQDDMEDEIVARPSSPVGHKMKPRSSTNHSSTSAPSPSKSKASAARPKRAVCPPPMDDAQAATESKATALPAAKRLKRDTRQRRYSSPDELQGEVTSRPAKPSTAQAKGGARKSRFKYDNASEMLTNPNSPLGSGNLFKLITTGEGWSQLTQEQRQDILKAAPPEAVLDAGSPDARLNLDFLKNSTHFRHDVAQYQDTLRQGKHDGEWIRQAQAAHGKREAGFYRDYQKVAFERDWGTPMPASPKAEDVDTKNAGIPSEDGKSDTAVDTKDASTTIDNSQDLPAADISKISGAEENKKETPINDTHMTGVAETSGEANSGRGIRVDDPDRDHSIVVAEPSQQGTNVPPVDPS